ncbi:MAG: hypothetical protein AMXMBFR55_27320 [Gemmatimonadota bacterium]
MRAPNSSPSRQLPPKAIAISVTNAIVPTTCNAPPRSTSFPIRTMRDSDSSSPTAKRSSTTPISASDATDSVSRTSPSAVGPMAMPLTRNPTTLGMRSR